MLEQHELEEARLALERALGTDLLQAPCATHAPTVQNFFYGSVTISQLTQGGGDTD